MTFFADRNLGARLFPNVLRSAGLTVEVHDDHFPVDSPDVEWLPIVATRGWVVLTSDEAILRRVRERDALMQANAAVFVLVGGDAPTQTLASNFVNSVHLVQKTFSSTRRPFVAKVYRPNPSANIARGTPGHVRVVLTSATWKPGKR